MKETLDRRQYWRVERPLLCNVIKGHHLIHIIVTVMLRQSLKAGDSRLTPSPSVNNVLARLKSSFQQDKPASDRISESRAKISRHLRASRDSPCLRTPIDKSASEKKLKHLLKEANKHCRSSSVKALFSCDNTSKVRALKAQRLEAKSSTAKTLKDQLS